MPWNVFRVSENEDGEQQQEQLGSHDSHIEANQQAHDESEKDDQPPGTTGYLSIRSDDD